MPATLIADRSAPHPSGRLAFLLPNLRGGGAERVALRLIEDFIAHGYSIDLLLMAESGELLSLLPPAVRVIDLHAKRIRDVVRPLMHYLRTERPMGIQAFMWPLTVAAVIAHRLVRSDALLVLSEHTTLSRQYARFGRARRVLLRASIYLTYPHAHARVAVSKHAADDLAMVSGISRGSITVIYNPVDRPSAAGRYENDALTVWGDAQMRVLTVGTLKAAKNHVLLIEAFALLRRHFSARLVILGEGEMRDELEFLVAARGLVDDVILPGFHANPWPFYDTAQVFVLSSDYEGYGNVLIEAMRAGLSIVSTDCESGPREILDGGTFGRLVACDDAPALARALVDALDQPIDPAILQARAEALSGQNTSDYYLELMTAPEKQGVLTSTGPLA